jgi:hypothetical protein
VGWTRRDGSQICYARSLLVFGIPFSSNSPEVKCQLDLFCVTRHCGSPTWSYSPSLLSRCLVMIPGTASRTGGVGVSSAHILYSRCWTTVGDLRFKTRQNAIKMGRKSEWELQNINGSLLHDDQGVMRTCHVQALAPKSEIGFSRNRHLGSLTGIHRG